MVIKIKRALNFVMQPLDVFFHRVNELSLVLLDRTTDLYMRIC